MIAQDIESPSWPASMQNRLGEVAQAQGEYMRAGALHRESLRVFRDLGQQRDTLPCLEGLAWVAEAQEHSKRSAVLYGAVAALREATGAQVPPLDRASYARSVDRVQARLGQAAFAAAWGEGHAMPLRRAKALSRTASCPAVPCFPRLLPDAYGHLSLGARRAVCHTLPM